MGKNSNSSSVTLGNILSMLGIAIFGVLLFLGLSLNDLTMGVSILLSVGAMALLAVLLWLAIKAKGSDSFIDKWRWVEYVSISLDMLFAAVMAYFYIILPVNMIVDHDEYKQEALSDIDNCTEYVEQFKDYQSDNAAKFKTLMGDYLSEIKTAYPSKWGNVNRLMKSHNISMDQAGIEAFETTENRNIEKKAKEWNDNISTAKTAVDGWNLFQLPNIKRTFNKLNNIQHDLQIFSKEAFYSQKFTLQEDVWIIEGYNDFDDTVRLKFLESVEQARDVTVVGVVVIVLLLALLIFNYIVAPRSLRTKIRGGGGGVVL
jgi:hypothetical protein